MRLVGMIFTDLTDDGTGTGKVLFKRNAETFFLSSAEAYMSARMQLMAPSPCRLAGSGTFGSKVRCFLARQSVSQFLVCHGRRNG